MLYSWLNGHEPAMKPRRLPLIKPQPPVSNQPVASRTDNVLTRLAQRLRPTPNGCSTFLYSTVEQSGDTPHGLRQPADGTFRVPEKAGQEAPGEILRRRQQAVDAAGGSAPRGASADRHASRRDQAAADLRRRFSGPGAGALVDQLLGLAHPAPLSFERPLLIGCVLSRLAGGDAAAATRMLQGLQAAEPQGDAYAVQRALARCGGVGIDCLMALHPPADISTDPVLAAVQHQAYAARLRAADAIHHLLPPDLRPLSLADCVRKAGEGNLSLVGNDILVDGLSCAQALVEDPAAEVGQAQRVAYLALRNGLLTTTQLKQAQDRLFKINTYIERASERGARRAAHAVQRLFGYQKSPLHALTQLGTAQSKTRHPEDDLAARTVVMDAFVARMEAGLKGRRQRAEPKDSVMRRSIRIAAVRQWKQRIVDKGWRDEMPVGHRWRAAIAADVAAQLGCPAAQVERHPALASLRLLQAGVLAVWSMQEGIDQAEPVMPGDDRSYETALTRFREMHNHGDLIVKRPTVEQTRQLLHHAIADARQTYSVTFNQGSSMGLQGSMIDLLSLTPAVMGVGPSVAVVGGRSAYLVGGSNAHGGQVQVGSQRGVRLDAGIVGFVGKRLGDVVNLGLTASVMPLQFEHSRTQATALRTRMNVFGASHPTAWLDLLLSAYDTITWKDGERGAPDDAASMWSQLARRFYKNPDLSIDDLQGRQTSLAGSASVMLGARVEVGNRVQVGPTATLTATKGLLNRFDQKDSGANRVTEQQTRSAGHGVVAGAGLTLLAPSITDGAIQAHAGEPGATQALTLVSANLGGSSVGVLRNAAGVTMRLVTDQGRIDPDYSFMDTECGTARRFARYIDTQRADWIAALGGDAAAEKSLDAYLTRLVADEKRGNTTYGERRRMTPLAARRIDHFRAMVVALADTSGHADSGAKAEIERLEGEVSRVLNDPDSWDVRSLWALDLNQNGSSKGPSIILQLVSRKVVTAPRQRAVLVATGAPNRLLDEKPIG